MYEQSSLILECSNDPIFSCMIQFFRKFVNSTAFFHSLCFQYFQEDQFLKRIVRSEPRFIGCCQEEIIVLVHKVEWIVGDFGSSLSALDVWLAVQSSGLAIDSYDTWGLFGQE
jgi:hypothetical protein